MNVGFLFKLVLMIDMYIIESCKDGTWYTGMAKNAVARLQEHNTGKNRFTKGRLPWKIIYTNNTKLGSLSVTLHSLLSKKPFAKSSFLKDIVKFAIA